MPFTKTEVDIHDDYTVEAVDAAWLAQGVKSPKHLMLDPDNCILCRACEDVCPWNCIWMMSNEIVEQTDEASGLIESEQVDVEREAPAEEKESIERSEPRDNPGPPAFEE